MMCFESAEKDGKNVNTSELLAKIPVHFSNLLKKKLVFGEYLRCFFQEPNLYLKELKLVSGLHLTNGD